MWTSLKISFQVIKDTLCNNLTGICSTQCTFVVNRMSAFKIITVKDLSISSDT